MLNIYWSGRLVLYLFGGDECFIVEAPVVHEVGEGGVVDGELVYEASGNGEVEEHGGVE